MSITDGVSTAMPVAAGDFRSAMRRFAGAVSIVSGAGPTGPLGVTATAVNSLSAEPPSLICCLNRVLELESAIRTTGSFAINVLRTDHQSLAKRFAGMDGVRGTAKFDQGEWTHLPSSVPTLVDSLASFDCRVTQIVEVGTHSIFVGLVDGICVGEHGTPLVYCDGAFASLTPL